MKCTLELSKKDVTTSAFIDNICLQGDSHIRIEQMQLLFDGWHQRFFNGVNHSTTYFCVNGCQSCTLRSDNLASTTYKIPLPKIIFLI